MTIPEVADALIYAAARSIPQALERRIEDAERGYFPAPDLICYVDHVTGDRDHMNAHVQTYKCRTSRDRR